MRVAMMDKDIVAHLEHIDFYRFCGPVFNVSRLSFSDWMLMFLITSQVLIVADVVRTVRNVIRKR